jgi:thymidylate kinase
MTCNSTDFFKLFFGELEKRSIPCVILHSDGQFPEKFSSAIDYAVPREFLPKLRAIQAELARQNGWALVQTSQPGVFAYYAVLVSLENPAEFLKLNACSNDAPNRFGPGLLLRGIARIIKRVLQPAGFSFAVLGSDGSGKSTLLGRLQILLAPCFRGQKTLHFRPQVFGKRTAADDPAIANPHGQTPENPVLSWLRVGYYFADHWAGWFLIVMPGRIRGTLVIFDRCFDDLLVDQKRYRLSGVATLASMLRYLLPQPQCVFILSAPAPMLHQRKPELTVPELERQQLVLRQLARSGKRYKLIATEEPPDRVAEMVWREVVLSLAAREEKRG